MIYEIALLPVHQERVEPFRQAFADVAPLLRRAKGYRGHMLAQGIETPERFNLIVRWQTLEDHTPGFEASEDHRQFMMALEDYFSDEPQVYHIEGAAFAASEPASQHGFFDMLESPPQELRR
ncbi:antibiotic biosynthesis monooxygenase [Ectopseudomonas mendocina]|uniref:Antibiotic biosynthesis monooxygenase n=1 Tax=Ectopseudomonas mendocina TaxID=300 RepID=A0ABD7RXV0_ECTME|nr:antibiotic biosynthesis monooxygenase [Pseudomonas mendocina]QTN46479.1 antibiotic biosynthesis monooxygenase [Pseudomonas mendocina]TRO14167.1 antibiotic biosynthesis monooxygenase [Pseudomonas mendocina]TRO19218.1 antibiotic biosynthesis monooxygenase [Pseudomonas mendocina]